MGWEQRRLIFFDQAHGNWKFPGQGWNSCQSGDNARSLTIRQPGSSKETFFFFSLFRAAPVAYGSSAVRGLIRAAAAGLHHSHGNAGSELHVRHNAAAYSNVGSLTH